MARCTIYQFKNFVRLTLGNKQSPGINIETKKVESVHPYYPHPLVSSGDHCKLENGDYIIYSPAE